MSSSSPRWLSAWSRSAREKPRRALGAGSRVRCEAAWLGVAARIVAAQRAVEGDGDGQQDHGVQRHRPQHEAVAQAGHGRAAQDGGQRHRAAGRMQAAQREHGGDGQRAGRRRGQARIRNGMGAGHADQRGHQIAGHDGPGLGQRAGGRGEQQHGGRAHRRDEPGIGFAQRVAADPFGAEQADQRAQRAIDLFAGARAHGRRGERCQPALECNIQLSLLAGRRAGSRGKNLARPP